MSASSTRALWNANQIAFLVEWDDDDLDDLDSIRRYHDAAAIQPYRRVQEAHLRRSRWERREHASSSGGRRGGDIDSGGKTGVDQICPRSSTT